MTILPTGMSATWKPVPSRITSTSRSTPSSSTIAFGLTSLTPEVTSSTLSAASAGYHLFEGRMRLQPIV